VAKKTKKQKGKAKAKPKPTKGKKKTQPKVEKKAKVTQTKKAQPTKKESAQAKKEKEARAKRREEWLAIISKLKTFSRDLDKIVEDIPGMEADVDEISDNANQKIEEISSEANRHIEDVVNKKRDRYKTVIGELGDFSRALDGIVTSLSVDPKKVGKKKDVPERPDTKQDVIQNLRYLQQWIWVCIRDFEHADSGEEESA